MNNIEILHEIVKETYGTEFRLTCNSKEWRLYIVRGRTNFTGTFDEVVDCAIDEFLSYRQKSPQKQTHKYYKPFVYK